ncbi:copper chaperone PCu(A)C [Mesorhizobium sp. BR1-1-2]|uniref:copper chaperone PCu(A)C n=1 Tax=Mesorhizobium sp. BR1-1-2 TaxID=2876652 RepID=UPI001CD02803|nr:copper chaperone PCu(A)C [Mesorhizobium sp. BR1-1-2]MBZ9963112.1 copper chaperone PCu(A)C [Mesorhizobium sp. BR1-1-2]
MRTIYTTLVLAFGLLGLGIAVAASNQIVVEKAWARATPMLAVTGGGYLTVTNQGPEEDRLLGVTSPLAEKIQFHAMAIDNGVAKMIQLSAIELHPGVPVVFKPGGIHMMLLGLKRQLKEGETVPLTLMFEKAGAIELDARILGIAATGDHGDAASGD